MQAKKEVVELQKAATLHTREAASLALVRRRLSEAETQVDRLRFENEVWLWWSTMAPCHKRFAGGNAFILGQYQSRTIVLCCRPHLMSAPVP